MATHDVLILREGTHGMPAESYAEALSERLDPDRVTLARTPAEEREGVRTAPIVAGNSISPELVDLADNLELFACSWAGTGHLPMDTLRERDITVTNASGTHAPNIAETVLGHILVFARRLDEGWRRAQRTEWRHFQAHELAGSTVTVVGQGSIGQAIVQRLAGFEVDTIGVRYSPEKGGPADEVVGFDEDELHAALARTDYLVIASPLTETTRGLIGEEEFATLRPNAVLVNIGRGKIVDTDALESAIRGQDLRGAALDVTDPEPLPADHPLWSFENVHITPHNSGHSPAHWDRLADIVAENVTRLDDGKMGSELKNVVYAPDRS